MKLFDQVSQAVRQLDRAWRVRGFSHTARLAVRVLWAEGPSGVRKRLDALGPTLSAHGVKGDILILTMPHTMHFAQRMQAVLAEAGIASVVSDNDRAARGYPWVIAIAPQNFPAVAERNCIAFQVEQHVSDDRWTPQYLDRLAKCAAVWDFSVENIARMSGKVAFRKLYHVPFWPVPSEPSDRQGVLFYGVLTPRRKALLEQIRAAVPCVGIETNLFGARMADRLSKAAIVLNLHAQTGALLETARLSEALSHGAAVLSETGRDQALAGEIPGVRYAPEGDATAMITALRDMLKQPPKPADPGPDRFRTGILRAVQGMGMIDASQFDALTPNYPAVAHPFVTPPANADGLLRRCLSLPETPARAASFLAHNGSGFPVWPGLKADPGWRGAALSYRRIMRELQRSEISEALIVEDDAILPPDFEARLKIIRNHMDECDGDLFSGMIVDLHKDARVLNVTRRDGLVLVELDRAVMMLCNLYRPRMIAHLAQWDDTDDNAFSNTIDRYMERATHLRVVTTLPFLASYGAGLNSTLREADNHKFDALLARSQADLAAKVASFEAARMRGQSCTQRAAVAGLDGNAKDAKDEDRNHAD